MWKRSSKIFYHLLRVPFKLKKGRLWKNDSLRTKSIACILLSPTIIEKVKGSIQNFVPIVCWGPKCDKEVHSMKSKEGPWALTKEDPACEVKKDHGGPNAQKEGKWKKKVKRSGPKLGPQTGPPSSRKWVHWEKAWKSWEGCRQSRRSRETRRQPRRCRERRRWPRR